jgi:hypothetical protein
MLLGVTNPLFLKALGRWPNALVLRTEGDATTTPAPPRHARSCTIIISINMGVILGPRLTARHVVAAVSGGRYRRRCLLLRPLRPCRPPSASSPRT